MIFKKCDYGWNVYHEKNVYFFDSLEQAIDFAVIVSEFQNFRSR